MARQIVPSTLSCLFVCAIFFIFLSGTISILVFQPSYLIATGPTLSVYLLGNTSGISLNLKTVSPSKTTGRLPPPSCEAEPTEWVLTSDQLGKTSAEVQLRLNRSLLLCGDNETDTDCCPAPLCVLEILQVSACLGNALQASLLVQVKIYALLVPTEPASDNITVIPNQVYQPLGSCPCDLTLQRCDIRCCCDKDCSPEDLKLFEFQCLPGPFGGQVSPTPDYQCSAQTAENAPDWFPFLCVHSPPENNPYLGLFYQGKTIAAKPGPSFQKPEMSTPVPNEYRQGDPIVTINDEYLTIPQNSILGQCLDKAPVAFLKNFNVKCVTPLQSCPNGPPLQMAPSDLMVQVKNGQGGIITVDLVDEVAVDLSGFVPNADSVTPPDERRVCENVTLALEYKFFWQGNSLTGVELTRTVGNISLKAHGVLTARYSAVFLNGDATAWPNSGNPGYQVGRPVIGGFVDAFENNTGLIERTYINLRKPVSEGLCNAVETRPVVFGENATAGCVLPVSLQNMTQCESLREIVASLQAALVPATLVARTGDPDPLRMADWVNISLVAVNYSRPAEEATSSCSGILSHQHIHVQSIVTDKVGGIPQREIYSLEISYRTSTWRFECGGGESSPCVDPTQTQSFPVTSTVTFTDIPVNTGPPKTRFQINFTEYDCDRNDVCWPELAFPMTSYYTGEPQSQSLAKGLILAFFFIAASVLGAPWRQIRQAWSSAAL